MRIAACVHRQIRPFGDGEIERIGRPAQPARAGDGLARRSAGADLRAGVAEGDAAIWRHLDLGETGLRAIAEAPLDAAEADAVVPAGMPYLIGLLARGAAGPQLMRPRL